MGDKNKDKDGQKRVREVLGKKPSGRQADKAADDFEKRNAKDRSRKGREVQGREPNNSVKSHRKKK